MQRAGGNFIYGYREPGENPTYMDGCGLGCDGVWISIPLKEEERAVLRYLSGCGLP